MRVRVIAAFGLVAGALVLATCTVDVDYDDSEFQCRKSDSCPDEHACVDNQCVPLAGAAHDGGASDAAAAEAFDAAPADAPADAPAVGEDAPP